MIGVILASSLFQPSEDSCGHTSDMGIEGWAPQILWIMNVKI